MSARSGAADGDGALGVVGAEPVAWRDPDGSVHYSDGRSGPAGVAGLDLANGAIRLVVDYVEPGTVVRLVLDHPGDDELEALGRLLGRPSLGHDELPEDGSLVELHVALGSKLGGRRPHPLAALALLTADLEERPLSSLDLGLSLLEAAALLGRFPREARVLLRAVDPAAVRERGARLVLDARVDDVLRAVPPARETTVVRMLADAARELGGELGVALDELARVISFAEGDGVPRVEVAAAVPPPAAALPAAAGRSRLRRAPPPEPERRRCRAAIAADPSLAAADIEVWRSRGHVEASATIRAGGDAWLRVSRLVGGGRPVPLAVVPFVARRGGVDGWPADSVRRALGILSEAEIDDELVVELTPAPVDVPLAGRLQAVRDACTLGREAVRADRAGERGRAVDLWRACAAAWRTLDDDVRARDADERATLLGAGFRPAASAQRRRGGSTGPSRR